MSDFPKEYGYRYHTYPVHAMDFTYEGAFKRFTTFPTPQRVYNMALMGLPKYFPLTKEAITVDFATPYLESAITEIEQDLDCNLSEVDHFHSADYIQGMFEKNFSGIRLPRWPATKIISIAYKYPHTNTVDTYQQYNIPSEWVYLNKNNVNIVASMGAVMGYRNVTPNQGHSVPAYAPAFMRGWWTPGVIEITYTAGFKHDQIPSNVADLITTWAAARMLTDILPALFPSNSVNVSIDGVSQSVGFSMQQTISARLEALEKKKEDLKKSFQKGFSRTMRMVVVGS